MSLLVHNGPWMTWNMVLALVPLAAALVLFTGTPRRHSALWWLGAATFLLFLPNAPYVLTDVVHLLAQGRSVQGSSALIVALVAQYCLLFAIGIGAYVGSLQLLRGHLTRLRWSARSLLVLELAIHAACALGVYLGRFGRLNSWALPTDPGRVVGDGIAAHLDRPFAWVILAITFAVLVGVTVMARAFGVGVMLEWRSRFDNAS